MFNLYLLKVSVQFVTTTSQFTLSERNGLVYKTHPRFLAQKRCKKVQLIHKSLRYCLLGSTVTLYWIRRAGNYKQFVSNRVSKIQHLNVQWRHMPSQENPADLGSRGGSAQGEELWWKGPNWLPEKDRKQATER